MQGDGAVVVVDVPELLKDALGLAAGVDEDERGPMLLDQPVDLRERVARRMAGPGKTLARIEHAHIRCGAAFRDDEIGARAAVSSAGSATVAERPVLAKSGARRKSRARPRERRSPRFEVTRACSSSRITRL